VSRERAQLVGAVVGWKRQREAVEEAQVFLELAEEGDGEAVTELEARLARTEQELEQLELEGSTATP